MKKIYILFFFINITFCIHPDKFIKTTLEDFNLNGKVKTFRVIHKLEGLESSKTVYHFNTEGILYKIGTFYGKNNYYIKNFIYSENGLLLKTESYDKDNNLVERNTIKYDDKGMITEVYIDNKARSVKYMEKYVYDSEIDELTVTCYNDNVDHNKVVISNYLKIEYKNNRKNKYYEYSTKIKLKSILHYFYDEKNNLSKIEYKKIIGKNYKLYKVIIYKYKYGIFDNPLIKKEYEKIGKKIEKFIREEEYQYEYY